MKITIKTLQGKPTEYEVGEEETLADLKAKIAEGLSINIESQKIIHYGKVMAENEKKLVEYGVKDKDFLVLMVTKKATAPPAPAPVPPAPVQEPKPVSVPPSVPPTSSVPSAAVPPEKVESSAPAIPSKPVALEERMVMGTELEGTITSLMEMGFPREEVTKAMKAAYNNPERATDYLLNGIPAGAMDMPMGGSMPFPRSTSPIAIPRPGGAPTGAAPSSFPRPGGAAPVDLMPHPFGGEEEDEEGMEGMEGLGDLGQIRQRILQDPGYLQELMGQLQSTNPGLYALIQQNPQAMLQMLMGGAGGAGGAPRGAPPGAISVTPEEKDAIDRLKALGFSEIQAAQAFFACDKNEMLAANFLFENGEALRADEEEYSPVPMDISGAAASAPRPAAPAPIAPSEKKEDQPPEKKEEQPPEKKEEESSLQIDPKPEEKKTE